MFRDNKDLSLAYIQPPYYIKYPMKMSKKNV